MKINSIMCLAVLVGTMLLTGCAPKGVPDPSAADQEASQEEQSVAGPELGAADGSD